jgi:hypothetical protein
VVTTPTVSTPATTTKAKPKPKPTATTTTTTTTTQKPPAAGAPAAIQPARDWAWAPVPKASYYTVEFLRGTDRIYRTVAEKARLTLPDSVVFRPGAYRWIVRPGFGSRAAKKLGAPVVDSSFAVA